VTLSTRRHFSDEQKLAIVAEARASPNISAVARRHDLVPSQVFAWLRAFPVTRSAPAFLPVMLTTEAPTSSQPISTERPTSEPAKPPAKCGTIEIVLANGRTVRIAADADPGTIARLVAALEGTP
jgi:transposase